MFVLGGTTESGEEIRSITATVYSDHRIADRLSQEMIEDQQFLDFARAAQLRGELPAIECYQRPPSDPPDLLVTTRGREYAVELTSITTPEVSRQRLSEIRAIGHKLSELIRSDSERFAHLVGKTVSLAEMASDDQRPPKTNARRMLEIVNRLGDALGPQIGTVDYTPLTSPEAPVGTVIPGNIAMRGRVQVDETYWLEVHKAPDETATPHVVANCQVSLYPRRVAQTFVERVQKKDRPGNEFLLVTTGLPDKQGYVCPADHWVFHVLQEQALAGKIELPQPRYLRQIVLNHWGQPPWTISFGGDDGLLQPASK